MVNDQSLYSHSARTIRYLTTAYQQTKFDWFSFSLDTRLYTMPPFFISIYALLL